MCPRPTSNGMKTSVGILIAKTVFLLGLFFLAALGLRLLSRKTETPPVPPVASRTRTPAETKPVFPPFDADKDGLPDWEEALWGTDQHNPDTDNDGIPDGAEVAARRNPKKAGPNDSLEAPLMVTPREPERRVSGEPAMIQASSPEAAPEPAAETKTPEETDRSLHNFGNALGISIQNAARDVDAELAFWNSAAGNKKMTEELLQGFAKLAEKYDRLAAEVASVIPPSKAEETHSALAKAYQNYAKAIRAIANAKVGEYLSGSDMTEYGETALTLARAFVGVSDFFYTEGVRFGPNEPGSIFMFPR